MMKTNEEITQVENEEWGDFCVIFVNLAVDGFVKAYNLGRTHSRSREHDN